MQAILCRYHGPSNVRGSRISARCSAGSVTIPYPHELREGEETHKAAALALLAKLGWDKEGWAVTGGQLPNQDWAFCLVKAGPAPAGRDSDRIGAAERLEVRNGTAYLAGSDVAAFRRSDDPSMRPVERDSIMRRAVDAWNCCAVAE